MIALLYHDVVDPGREDDSGRPGGAAAAYKITPAEMRRHLEAIGPPPGRPDPRRPVLSPDDRVLTFDDGGASALATADLLEEHEWRGFFFVTTGEIGTPTHLSTDGIRELRARGHVVGTHSHTHPSRMGALGPDAVEAEWRRSTNVLADILGEPVTTASVPGGDFRRHVAETAAATGIRLLFTSEPRTRLGTIAGCVVAGRFTVRRGDPASFAAAIMAGRPLPRWKQALSWKAKKIAKRALGGTYLVVRSRLAGRG